MNLRRPFLMAAAIIVLSMTTATHSATAQFSTGQAPITLPEVKQTNIASHEIQLADFGGVGDGVTLNTDAFSKAIAHLSEKGGGRLIVPEGVWFTGPIVLQSNIDLHLTANSIIVFSADKDLYPIVPVSFEGKNTFRCQSPISAQGASNIAITGHGIIDGNGDPWRAVKKDKVTAPAWNRLVRSGGVLSDDEKTWYPSESYKRGAGNSDQNISNWATSAEDFASIKDFLRPVMIYLKECDAIKLEGVTFQNSPCWNIHLLLSSNITIDGITVRCPWYAQNGDGIDIESCDRVIVRNSMLDVGDDAICIKSGKDEDGRKRGVPSSNIYVDNCTVFHGHGGFVVGSEMSGGVKNIVVTNCKFSGTDVGLRFKSTRGRGGVVENIYIKDIVMDNIATEALLFDLFYGGKSASEALEDGDEQEPSTDMVMMPADETTPEFRNIYISDVICRNARRAMLFNGLPEMNVSNIVVENSAIHATVGAQINESSNVLLKNVKITPETGPALMINNVKNLNVTGFEAPSDLETVMTVTGSRNSKIVIDSNVITQQRSNISQRSSAAVTLK